MPNANAPTTKHDARARSRLGGVAVSGADWSESISVRAAKKIAASEKNASRRLTRRLNTASSAAMMPRRTLPLTRADFLNANTNMVNPASHGTHVKTGIVYNGCQSEIIGRSM